MMLRMKFGISWIISKRTLVKFNLARGFRAPNVAEISSNGVHEGTQHYVYGNNRLKPETSAQADLGLAINSKHLSMEISLFFLKAKRLGFL